MDPEKTPRIVADPLQAAPFIKLPICSMKSGHITYKSGFFRIFPLLIATILPVQPSYSGDILLQGRVRDRNTHTPLAHVNIFLKQYGVGTTTDASGSFRLQVPEEALGDTLSFRHVGYEIRKLTVLQVQKQKTVYLQPRVIPLPAVSVEALRQDASPIRLDLPQTIATISGREFVLRGYLDAGDLLRTDYAVQVEETLSGKKLLGLRGGNPDDVTIAIAGIPLNSTLTRRFDLSLLNLDDIQQIEIIRGSNSTIFGAEAFSGVINLVPQLSRDYTLRFQQRFGTYRNGAFGLQGHRDFSTVQASLSLFRSGWNRPFTDEPTHQLTNRTAYLQGMFRWIFNTKKPPGRPNRITMLWTQMQTAYENTRDRENMTSHHRLFFVHLEKSLPVVGPLSLLAGANDATSDQSLWMNAGTTQISAAERSFHVRLLKEFVTRGPHFTFGYQYRFSRLHFRETHPNGQNAFFLSTRPQRNHHGLFAIVHWTEALSKSPFQLAEISTSLRYDYIHDAQFDTELHLNPPGAYRPGIFVDNRWSALTAKFGFQITGYRKDLLYKAYFNFGTNTKFPTLFQQMSVPYRRADLAHLPRLDPEKNRSWEIGVDILREVSQHPRFFGWQFSASIFQNYYDNKFRLFTAPGIPFTFYDNTFAARIAGMETMGRVYLFRKKLTMEFGLSRYFISERAAFPFKVDSKRTFSLKIDHAGYRIQVFWFYEGNQYGWVRTTAGLYESVEIPAFSNVDFYAGKTFELGRLRLNLNLTLRNLRSDPYTLEGLSLRDRRYMAVLAAEI